MPWLGRSRMLRYEVRRWRGGVIPDVAEAVASLQRLSASGARAHLPLSLVPSFPTVTWGRDELDTGDMWNSYPLISWLLARSGHRVEKIMVPARGLAPGWEAGLVVAAGSATRRPRSRSDGSRGAQGARPEGC